MRTETTFDNAELSALIRGSKPAAPSALDGGATKVRRWDDLRLSLSGAYCVKGLLPRPALAMIYGASGSGKTFFAGRAALDVATGRPFLGRRTRRAQVAYIAAESPGSVENRFAAWREREGIEAAAIVVIAGGIDLASPESLNHIIEAIESEGGAGLIVIDTAAQAAPGLDEDAEGIGLRIRAMERLRDAFDACVLIVHHAGKDAERGARGHSSLRAAVDVEIEVKASGGIHSAKLTKARDGETGGELVFELRPFEIGFDDDGEPVTTCEVLATDAPPPTSVPRKPKGANQQIVLDALREAIAAHGVRHPGTSQIPPGVLTVEAETLARYALPRIQRDGNGRNSADSRKRESLNTALRGLEAAGFIGTWEGLRWLR